MRATADLLIHVDPDAGETLQQQIYAGIRRAILAGLLLPGAPLPSSRTLATDLGVCRTTLLLAFDQLIAEGYVATRPGSGTFVAPDLPDDWPRTRQARNAGRASGELATAPPPVATTAGAGAGVGAATRHPPLAARAETLADLKPRAWRLPGAPRPFRVGTPAVDLLPVRLWSQLTTRRLRSASPSQFDYGDWPPLRDAIAAHLRRARGTHCAADQIIIVAGAQGGLDLMARMLLDPGDAAWMEEPGYAGAHGALIAAGARIVSVPVDAHGLDVAAGIARAPDARLAYVTPSHQFPLGVVMSLRRRMALLAWANAAGAWIIEDDYDSEFRYGTRPVPCLHGMDLDGRVIYMGTFSKTLFPSLRLGFLVVPLDLRDRLIAARRALDFQPPVLNQAVLADFLGEGHYERHLRRMRAVYRERLDRLVDASERYCGGALRVRPVATGLHAVADLIAGDDEQRVSDEAMARGVEAMPLSLYFRGAADSASSADAADTADAANAAGAPPNGLLLGFAPVRPADVEEGMRKLAESIDAVRQRPTASQERTPIVRA